MCMPTNFGSRTKHISTFQRTKKVKKKDDKFFCDCEEFLNEKKEKKNENISIKS